MSAQHTPGWLAHRAGRIFSAERENVTIANIARTFDGDYSETNGRRLVACWNACDGIRTEALEQRAHLLKAYDDQLAIVTAQRDELLAALKWVVRISDEGGYPDGKCLQEARAAIAKATD